MHVAYLCCLNLSMSQQFSGQSPKQSLSLVCWSAKLSFLVPVAHGCPLAAILWPAQYTSAATWTDTGLLIAAVMHMSLQAFVHLPSDCARPRRPSLPKPWKHGTVSGLHVTLRTGRVIGRLACKEVIVKHDIAKSLQLTALAQAFSSNLVVDLTRAKCSDKPC